MMKTKEYRIFEVDKYENRWFATSFSGNPEIQKMNAEIWIKNKVAEGDETVYVIEEHG